MYYLSAQGVDERMINVHYYYADLYIAFAAGTGHVSADLFFDVVAGAHGAAELGHG